MKLVRTNTFACLWLVAAWAALVTMASAETVPVTLVGQWGGPSYAVAVVGNRVYLGMGRRLVILDVSFPANPVVLGQSELLPNTVRTFL